MNWLRTYYVWCLGTALLAHPLQAAVFVHSVNLGSQTAGWTNLVNLPQFNPTLGDLASVTLRIYGTLDGSAGIENLEDKFSSIAAYLLGDFRVYDAGQQEVLNLALSATQNQVVDPFDGELDYGGTSGYTFGDLQASGQTSVSYLIPGDDLSAFIGLGTLSYTVATSDNSYGESSAGTFAFFSSLLGSGTLQITYTTAILPEPTTMANFVLAMGVVYLLRNKRKRYAR